MYNIKLLLTFIVSTLLAYLFFWGVTEVSILTEPQTPLSIASKRVLAYIVSPVIGIIVALAVVKK